MPLVRIDTIEGRYGDAGLAAIGDVAAALATVGARDGDRFQVFATYAPGRLVYRADHLGSTRTDGCVAIQITMDARRSRSRTTSAYAEIAEVPEETWSSGNCGAHHAGIG